MLCRCSKFQGLCFNVATNTTKYASNWWPLYRGLDRTKEIFNLAPSLVKFVRTVIFFNPRLFCMYVTFNQENLQFVVEELSVWLKHFACVYIDKFVNENVLRTHWSDSCLLSGIAKEGPSVARWYIFKPKNLLWVNFGRSCNGRCWYFFTAILSILRPNGIVYGYLVHFVLIWYIFTRFGMLYRENLATLEGPPIHMYTSRAKWRQ
jgi:hypothetical protein